MRFAIAPYSSCAPGFIRVRNTVTIIGWSFVPALPWPRPWRVRPAIFTEDVKSSKMNKYDSNDLLER
jgi:hypothetical protein